MNLLFYTYYISNIIIYILQNRKSIKINISFISNQLKKLNLT